MIKIINWSMSLSLLFGLLCFFDPAFSQSDFWETISRPGRLPGSLAINNDNDIFLNTSDGLFRSTDNGNSWSVLFEEGGSVQTSLDSNNYIFVHHRTLGLVRSTDNGMTWTQTNIGAGNRVALGFLHSGDILAGRYSLIVNPDDGLYRSTDGGINWVKIGVIEANVIVVNSAGDIFAGTGGGGIFRSSDNGDTWTEINSGLTNKSISDITINSAGDVFAATSGGIFRSIDNGDTWTKVYHNLTNRVNALIINSKDEIFAGLSGGPRALESVDNGDTWNEIRTGLTSVSEVIGFAVNSNDVIFAITTGGNGIFRSIESPTYVNQGIRTLPAFFALEQNYPNPFNPTTMINYKLSSDSRVKLSVFNLLGEEVSVLVNAWQSVGSYQVLFDASNLPNGVYFYKIQTSDFSETRKMLLMK